MQAFVRKAYWLLSTFDSFKYDSELVDKLLDFFFGISSRFILFLLSQFSLFSSNYSSAVQLETKNYPDVILGNKHLSIYGHVRAPAAN